MHRQLARLIVIVLLAALAFAQTKSVGRPTEARPAAKPAVSLPSEETVNAFMQQMFGHEPALTWKIAEIKPSVAEGLAEVTVLVSSPQGQQSIKLYVTADGRHAMTGEMIPFGAKPFAAAREQLEKGINGPARGPADAAVTIVEFSDLQCPHCKEAQPIIEQLLSEEKNVRFVFQSFPLPSHNWAAKAAAYADCVGRASNDAFWTFVQLTYGAQAEITEANADEKLTGIADKARVKGADIAACAAKPETAARVQHSLALGKSVDVTGTPALFINGRKLATIAGVPVELLKKLVEFQAKQEK